MDVLGEYVIEVEDLSVFFGNKLTIEKLSHRFRSHQITAVMGPSGSGKSTFLRSINRMHDEVENAVVRGRILFNGEDILSPKADVILARSVIGMVFQKPNPFPNMSILENVLFGYRRKYGKPPKGISYLDIAEEAMRGAGIFGELFDRRKDKAYSISGGQQQRVCIARAIAVEPDVLLMDEPCSALDDVSTGKIEELMLGLREKFTFVLVTHNKEQAQRISDETIVMFPDPQHVGHIIEAGRTHDIFHNPVDHRVADFVAGRKG